MESNPGKRKVVEGEGLEEKNLKREVRRLTGGKDWVGARTGWIGRGTHRGLRHEHRVQVRLRLDVFAVGVVQDGSEALPVLNWGEQTSVEKGSERAEIRDSKEQSPGEGESSSIRKAPSLPAMW